MKLNTSNSSIQSSHGVGESTGFRIAANAHAFKMLSSGLYSDKISAVLREIGCNAADAHIAGGIKHVPIEVKLPNKLDPLFFIRDRGPGLSDADVRELYTTYFASTKQTSNDFTGAFGLGSKSPFSYTDSFTVTSCHAGKMNTYIAHLDKHGSPVITHMGEQPVEASWPSGVMISFPVRTSDFSEFQQKARAVYSWFTPLPKIYGLEDRWCPERTTWYASDTVEYYTENQAPAVLMGNVRYPLQQQKLPQLANPAHSMSFGVVHRSLGSPVTQTTFALELARLPILLKLPIGSVQVAASREELQYDEESRTALVKALNQVAVELQQEAGRRLFETYSSTTGWAQRVAVKACYDALPQVFRSHSDNLCKTALEAYCKDSEQAYSILAMAKQVTVPVPQWVTSDEAGVTVKLIEDAYRRRGRSSAVVKNGFYEKSNRALPAVLSVNAHTFIYVGDCDKAEDRMFAGVEKTQGLLLTARSRAQRDKLLPEAQRIAAALGDMPVVLVSSLPELPGQVKKTSLEVEVDVLELNSECSSSPDRWITSATRQPLSSLKPEEKFYLVRDGLPSGGSTLYTFEYVDDSGERVEMLKCEWGSVAQQTLAHIYNAFRGLRLLGELPQKFILVTPSQVSRLKLLENGYRPYLGRVREVLQGATFAKAVKDFEVDGVASDFSKFSRVATSSILGYLRTDADVANAVLQLPLPLDIRLLLTAVKNAPKLPNNRTELRKCLENAFGPAWEFFALPRSVMTTEKEICDVLAAQYPVLEFLSREAVYLSDRRRGSFLKALPFIFGEPLQPVIEQEVA